MFCFLNSMTCKVSLFFFFFFSFSFFLCVYKPLHFWKEVVRKEMFYFTVIWRKTCKGPLSDSERGNSSRYYIGYSFRLASIDLLYVPSQRQDSIAHTTAFVIQVVEHWLKRKVAQWVHHEESIPAIES